MPPEGKNRTERYLRGGPAGLGKSNTMLHFDRASGRAGLSDRRIRAPDLLVYPNVPALGLRRGANGREH